MKNENLTERKNELEVKQLSLFTDLSEEGHRHYSNTLELWSIAPKIWVGGVKREKGKTVEALGIVKRDFEYANKKLSLTITPAGIEDKKTGKKKDFYPSQREELIEEALIKIAARKMQSENFSERPTTIDGLFAVRTTYYEIAKELLRLGHGYKIADIKLGIDVGNKAMIELKSKEGNEVSYSTPMFPFLAKETKEMGGNECLVITLHPLVTKSIKEGSFRLLNYDKMMGLKKYLSRWIYRRISHNFTGADCEKPYPIKLTTIVNNSAMVIYENTAQMIKQVEACFDELKGEEGEEKALKKWERKRVIFDEKKKAKINDIVYSLYLSSEFVSDIIKANDVIKRKDPRRLEDKIDVESLEKEMKREIFQLSESYVRNKIKSVKKASDVNKILLALAAAEEKINSGQEVNAVAYTKAAINDGYKPRNHKNIKNEAERESGTIIELNAESVDFSNDERWLKIQKEIKQESDDDDWKNWLSFLDIKNIENEVVVFNAPNKFVRDWCLRRFIYDCEQYGIDKNKSLLSLVQRIMPRVKKVLINSLEY